MWVSNSPISLSQLGFLELSAVFFFVYFLFVPPFGPRLQCHFFPFWLNPTQYLHVSSTVFTVVICRTISRCVRSPIHEWWKKPTECSQKGWFTLHSSVAHFTMLVTKFYCFTVFCLAFETYIPTFKCNIFCHVIRSLL